MRFSWVMQDLLLRLGGHGGVKQTNPAEACPLALYASSSIPPPVQVFTLVSGAFLILPGSAGSQAAPAGRPSSEYQVRGAGLEDGAHARAGAQPELVHRARGHGGHEGKADVDEHMGRVGGGAHARDGAVQRVAGA